MTAVVPAAAALRGGRPGTWPAYRAYAAIGARQELAAGAAIVGRVVFLGIILLIFSRLWNLALARGFLGDRPAGDLVWYLAVTEWVALSFFYLQVEVEADLRSGDIVARLTQPVSYIGARLAEAGGATVVRLLVLGPSAAVLATLLAGGLPREPEGLLLVAPLGLLAAAFALQVVACIGLTAVWLHDASPLFWMWQKLAFLFGGLLIPLEAYPEWLRGIALLTPFAAMLNGPGRMVFGFDPAAAAAVGALLLAWNGAMALLLAYLWKRALRAFDGHGG